MPIKKIPEHAQAIGYRALVEQYALAVLPHYRWSFIIEQGARQQLLDEVPALYLYDQSYALEDPTNPLQQLAFALKHEGLNLEIITQFFSVIAPDVIEQYVAAQPTGKYQRMIWYLAEKILYLTFDIPDLQQGAYISLLNEEEYYTATPVAHARYRLYNNLLGNLSFCPLVRKTAYLKKIEAEQFDAVARAIVKEYNPLILERASNYLYAQETMSSYKIERERPSKERLARFISLVKKAEEVPMLSREMLITLQNNIVDARFADHDYRTTQNYIGQNHETVQHQTIHYISPKPENVHELMAGLFAALERMLASNVHPIVIAAAISFAFVFIHPFEDGNGRLHRFLVHYILHRTGFTPPGMIFPVSAVIVLDMKKYNLVLEHFSKPLMASVTAYDVGKEGRLVVKQDTISFYAFVDYTVQTEFLAACIARTVETDFKKELMYLVHFDQAMQELTDIVDMPDRLLDLFITVVIQNNGILSANKKESHFAMLTDTEIHQMQEVVKKLLL